MLLSSPGLTPAIKDDLRLRLFVLLRLGGCVLQVLERLLQLLGLQLQERAGARASNRGLSERWACT